VGYTRQYDFSIAEPRMRLTLISDRSQVMLGHPVGQGSPPIIVILLPERLVTVSHRIATCFGFHRIGLYRIPKSSKIAVPSRRHSYYPSYDLRVVCSARNTVFGNQVLLLPCRLLPANMDVVNLDRWYALMLSILSSYTRVLTRSPSASPVYAVRSAFWSHTP
jgi:hypothetical protein